MPTFDQSSPYVFQHRTMRTHLIVSQVAANPDEKPNVDLVVVRENTECLVCHFTYNVSMIGSYSPLLRHSLVREAGESHDW